METRQIGLEHSIESTASYVHLDVSPSQTTPCLPNQATFLFCICNVHDKLIEQYNNFMKRLCLPENIQRL